MSETLVLESVASASREKKYPDGEPYKSLSVRDVFRISESLHIHGRQVETAALENGVIPERYARNRKMLLPEEQATLLRSSVSVVGLGGLGGAVIEILARMGVGFLNLTDGDKFEDSNLNRQLLSNEKNLEQTKAGAALRRIKEINSSVEVSVHEEFVSHENMFRILGKPDVIVDCLDNIKTRFVLEKAAQKIGCAYVTAAVAGVSGHVTVIFPGDPGLEMLYGHPDEAPSKGAEAELGNLPPVVTLMVSLQCSEVARILLGGKSILKNRILAVDLTDNTFEVLELE
ncbi:HesA/MoeB/ThiF family protein [Desulfonema magnum]|uniref:THIF-type NAD/FAD binding fold-containing protein n=1 Tax=Desulfonema magnum TaxID=45655 RepID=A0A975GT78_9BACT|nr:HesA/MoeB/ThiF family protein [Desulfonema magnum]QTA92712.1 THIF-type NAD/FAD binding fold-containing protein [Desulfonema magnum]